VKTALELSHLEIVPGQQGRVEIDVTNNADVIDGVTAIVDGINPDWVRLERPLISLFPDTTDSIELVLDIPTTCAAGDYLVIVRIVSTIDADRQTVHDFWLTVTPVPALTISLTPAIVTGGSAAMMQATVTNTGNTNAAVTVEAIEPTRAVDCATEPTSIVIPYGGEALVEIQLRGKQPWFGDPATRQILVTARTDDFVVEQPGTFRQKPKIPRGVLTALILAGIILLWALIFFFVIRGLTGSEDPAKAVGTGFLEGPENIPIARVAATLEGTVTASTTGKGVPRITVEASRVNSKGQLESVGSAATDDDGNYSLKSLIPGTYKVEFSAAGFQRLWYDGAGDASTADEITLDPRQVLGNIDAVVTGDLGRLVGKIDVPPDSAGEPLTVTATLVGEDQPRAEAVTTDGNFVLEGLPTPGTYLITVTGDGFQTQQFEQTLSGGETTVANTVQITAAAGTIEGTVRDAQGTPLGGVAVTARSGDLVLRSITPTSGNVGQFQIVGLQTPQTYSVTFELPNYTSATVALSLAAGQSSTGLNVTLIGGAGTVTGQVVSPSGAPVGGASVTVLGDNVKSETTTLTTGGIGGGPGSFTVSGLPVPGNYTISISGPRLQTETLGATFIAGGTQNVGTVTVLPTTSQVAGTVSSPGVGGLGEVEVTLTDGTRPRVTRSATNPAGAYAFADVPAGSYTLTFRRTGYVTTVALVSVQAGVDLTQNVNVAKASP
jgi:hypothetical protein